MMRRVSYQLLMSNRPDLWVEKREVSEDGRTWKLQGCFIVQKYHVAPVNNPVMMEPFLPGKQQHHEHRVLH